MHLKPKPKTPEFAATEPAINAAYESFWAAPDFPAFRGMAGDVDAVMPPWRAQPVPRCDDRAAAVPGA
ncbi:hypothetical protein DL771_009899 [Monosporascus sp. 5C6A]|nr:hypothetical protein DL771_009899 [Monosporascus sp. 5C6A]